MGISIFLTAGWGWLAEPDSWVGWGFGGFVGASLVLLSRGGGGVVVMVVVVEALALYSSSQDLKSY